MITIYEPEAQDFSTLGLGALAPYECVIEEQAGGMYELTMTHPMDAEGKWLNIGVGCIVKAPAPVRETPLVESEIVGEGEATEPVTVTRKIYKVQTNTGANLHLRQGPSTSTAILSKYRPGTEVVVLSQASGWGQVIVCSSGATGYMSMQYLVYVRDETETIEGDAPGPERVVYPVQSRMQLFRIYKVERDAAEREVRVEARHIFYDLLGNVVKNEYAPEGEAADAVVEELFDRALNPHDFSVHCQTARSVTGEYTRRGLVECLLDPDDGVLPQTGARLVRDNFDVWILPDATRETGVTIRHGKNLLGATLTTDWDSLVTRIIPVGQDAEGKALLLEGTTYMDSPHIGDYPVICAQAVEYDVKIGQEGIDNAAQARAKLQELAEADFSDNGVDLPTVGLDVDFVALGETEEYRAYADLEAVHLYDTVRVIAKSAGIDAAVRVTGYKWDALVKKYESVTLGEITDLKTTVYGYELQRGSVKTVKIAPGAVGSAQLRELAVQYAHINTAAVEQLSANSITALKAYITEIVAGSVTTDELYAGIASIALAQITTANIENANIDWAQIGTLSADIATIAKAHLTDADIDWAQIANLTAAVAEIAQVEIGEAVIDGAQITDGTITNAKIENGAIDTAKIALGAITTALIATGAVGTAQIADGSITDAKIVSLNADVINAGTLSVDRLLLKGPDGLFVAINATDEGLTSEQLSQEEYQNAISGSVLVARSVTADKIAAKSITANEIAAGTITTAELAAESVDASKIKAGSITTSHVAANFGETLDISSNKQVEIIAGNVQQAQETADSAQEAAEQAAPYISATPPETAPEAGKLWLDEGVEPSVLRKWRGADVTTEREYTETRVGCGKNLYDVNDQKLFSDGVTVDADGWITVSVDNSAGSSIIYKQLYTNPSLAIMPSTQYAAVCEIVQIDISGQIGLSFVDPYNDPGAFSQFAQGFLLVVGENTQTGTRIQVVTSRADLSESGSMLRTNVTVNPGASGTIKFRLSVLEDTSITAETFEYEPYQDVPFLSLDNGAGQIESVAVEAGCRARQAGTGDPSPENIRAITGRDSVEIAACGKNLFDINDRKGSHGSASVEWDENGWITISANNTNGASTIYGNYFTEVSSALRPNTNYIIAYELVQADISGDVGLAVISNNPGSLSQFTQDWSMVIDSSRMGTHLALRTTTFDFANAVFMLRTFVYFNPGSSGTVKFRLSVLQYDPSMTAETFVYEPYRSMGGGTIAPTEPLYGLPGAEDTVEVSTDGDVTVTRRTAVLELDGTEDWIRSPKNNQGYYYRLSIANIFQITTSIVPNLICSHYQTEAPNNQWGGTDSCISQNYNANARTYVLIYDTNYAESDLATWKSYLAAQASAGTPVTIVYELAAPETEALTAISPIAPQAGQLNLFTDADALTATIHGSGWETVNDTNDIRAALADVDSDVAGLIAGMGLLEGTVAQLGEQIITPEGVVSIVAASDGYQALVNMASQSADGLELVQTTVSNLNGRVETLEEGVHVEGSNVGLYSSGSPFRMDIDHTGIGITENGQPTITVRESRADIPRITTQTLILGSFAYRAGENDLYQMIV